MLEKVIGSFFMSVCAVLATIMACVWWYQFGVHEVYPYPMTFIAGLLWVCVYIMATEKED